MTKGEIRFCKDCGTYTVRDENGLCTVAVHKMKKYVFSTEV